MSLGYWGSRCLASGSWVVPGLCIEGSPSKRSVVKALFNKTAAAGSDSQTKDGNYTLTVIWPA